MTRRLIVLCLAMAAGCAGRVAVEGIALEIDGLVKIGVGSVVYLPSSRPTTARSQDGDQNESTGEVGG